MIIVTGGAGFIGSFVVKKFLSQSYKVLVIDNFNNFYDPKIKRKNIKEFISDIDLYETDIRDYNNLIKIFKNNNIEAVIHLAAMAGVRPSIENPRLYSDVNITGTLNLLELCKLFKIQKFIFASSSSVYGNCKKLPFCETNNIDFPISPYAATKKAGEVLCHNYQYLYNIDITCLRFFNAYGPSLRPDLAIYLFSELILKNKPITIFGDGNTKRDYTYIDDIVDGVYKAYEKLKGFNIYNLGRSETIEIKNLVNILGKNLNKQVNIEYLPKHPADLDITFADVTKAKKELGYNPKVDIQSGIPKFIEWFLALH